MLIFLNKQQCYSSSISFSGVGINKSLIFTPNAKAIFFRVVISGWEVFVHHFDTVAGSFPNLEANHLLVFFAPQVQFLYDSILPFCHLIAFDANLIITNKNRK